MDMVPVLGDKLGNPWPWLRRQLTLEVKCGDGEGRKNKGTLIN